MTAQLGGLNRRFELTEERIKVLKTVSIKKNYINRDNAVRRTAREKKKNEENEQILFIPQFYLQAVDHNRLQLVKHSRGFNNVRKADEL